MLPGCILSYTGQPAWKVSLKDLSQGLPSLLDYIGNNFRLNRIEQHPGTQRTLLQESSEGSEQCAGFSEYSVEECGNRPGYKQALTSRTITQVCHPCLSCWLENSACLAILYAWNLNFVMLPSVSMPLPPAKAMSWA